ncbi:MAG: hypothetical protein OXU25_03190 [Thaumarchaeota archaeon]|nr:hypothetical protein [Nitrososphaerota archaeon]
MARDPSRHSCRRIAGSLAEASEGACTVTHSQIWKSARKLGLDDVAWYVRRRRIRMVRAGVARIMFNLERHGALTITARRGDSVTTMRVLDAHRVELNPGRVRRGGAPNLSQLPPPELHAEPVRQHAQPEPSPPGHARRPARVPEPPVRDFARERQRPCIVIQHPRVTRTAYYPLAASPRRDA